LRWKRKEKTKKNLSWTARFNYQPKSTRRGQRDRSVRPGRSRVNHSRPTRPGGAGSARKGGPGNRPSRQGRVNQASGGAAGQEGLTRWGRSSQRDRIAGTPRQGQPSRVDQGRAEQPAGQGPQGRPGGVDQAGSTQRGRGSQPQRVDQAGTAGQSASTGSAGVVDQAGSTKRGPVIKDHPTS